MKPGRVKMLIKREFFKDFGSTGKRQKVV